MRIVPFFIVALTALFVPCSVMSSANDECHLVHIVHKLEYPGCTTAYIKSLACVGKCTSYVQVSGSKLWLQERSCMCCQESGEKEAIVKLDCKDRKTGEATNKTVVTKAPNECMCRPCTAIDEDAKPSEFAGYAESAFMKGLIKF